VFVLVWGEGVVVIGVCLVEEVGVGLELSFDPRLSVVISGFTTLGRNHFMNFRHKLTMRYDPILIRIQINNGLTNITPINMSIIISVEKLENI
jgi:hypothetical protein